MQKGRAGPASAKAEEKSQEVTANATRRGDFQPACRFLSNLETRIFLTYDINRLIFDIRR